MLSDGFSHTVVLKTGDGLKALAEVTADASRVLSLALRKEIERQERPRRADVITALLLALATVPPGESIQLAGSIFEAVVTALTLKDDISRKSYWKVVQRYGSSKYLLIKYIRSYTNELALIGPLARTVVDGLAMSFAFSSNSEDLVITGTPSGVVAWNREKEENTTVVSFNVHPGAHNIHISEDGSRCATGHEDGSVQLWHVGTSQGHLLCRLGPEGDVDPLNAVAFSSDNSKIATGSRGGTIQIWDIDTQANMHGQMMGHEDEVNMVTFSSDGFRLVSCADDRTIRVWSTNDGQMLQVFEGHTHNILSVAFSPCGKYIISGSWDDTAYVWDTTTGLPRKLEGHDDWVNCAVFSPNQKFVVSSSDDETVRVWDPVSGETMAVYATRAPIWSLGFSSDGKKLLSGSADGSIHIWDTSALL